MQSRLISDWCRGFAKLYEKHDQYRSPEEIWISVMAYCSIIGEDIRRTDYWELIDSAAHAFNWMCSYVNKCNTTDDPLFKCTNEYCDIIYFKFPGVCGHCTQSECKCDSYDLDKKKDKASKYRELYDKWKPFPEKRYNIPQWINNFKQIYKGKIHLLSLDTIGFHFLEEAGEEAQAIRQLIQLRNVLNENIEGIDKAYLDKLDNIEGLVFEYQDCMEFLKKKSDGKPDIEITSRDPKHIKARIVKGKMDLIVELADTFSWFCAILIKLEMIAEGLNLDRKLYDLDKCLENIYGAPDQELKCPRCESTDCKCLFLPLKGSL